LWFNCLQISASHHETTTISENGPPSMSILFIRGINDKDTAQLVPGPGGSVNYSFDGCCGVFFFMNFDSSSAEAITLFGDTFKQQQVHIKSKPSLVFNEISDPDSHHGALKHCEVLCRQLQLPVINHPSRILQTTRDNIYRMLHDIPGLTVPETIRLTPRSPEDVFTEIDRAGLAFPVIVRLAGSHGGKSCILITGRSDLDKLHVYPFDGSDFYLTEFVDYISDDGHYRKYRIVVIDGEPLYRHHMIDSKWMIHASSRGFMEENSFLMKESFARKKAFNEQTVPMIRPAIDEITRRLQLQYYGIDCNIDEQGNILIFEVNANMNILSNDFQPMEKQMQLIREHIRQLIAHHPGGNSQGISLQGG